VLGRDPHTVWDIADYRVPVVRNGETPPIGNHLLSNTDWESSLDLNDAASMNRFETKEMKAKPKRRIGRALLR
jgi:hypothetical protein